MNATWTYQAAPQTATISELVESYLLDRQIDGLSARTLEYYGSTLAAFADLSGPDTPITEIGHADIRAYMGVLFDRGCGRNSLALYSTVLSVFFGWLVAKGVIGASPFAGMPKPRREKALPRFLSESQVNALLSYCGRGYNGYRLRTIILTFVGAGLRVSELCDLDEKDVSLDFSMMRVKGKGSKERMVPVDKDLKPALQGWVIVRRRYLRGKAVDCLFPTRVYGRPTRGNIYDQIRNVGQRAGVAPLSPHVLRHSMATIYLANGGLLTALRDTLGHTSLSTTSIYTHTNAGIVCEDMRRASPLRNIERFDGRQMQLL